MYFISLYLVLQIHDRIVDMTELNDHQKSSIMEKIAVSTCMGNHTVSSSIWN